MKFVITGAHGQLGQGISKRLEAEMQLVSGFSSKELDITKLEAVRDVLYTHRPDVVINCAAYTAVDLAETHAETAHLVNSTGPKYLAQVAEEIDAVFIHFSTDYVFSGESEVPYVETDSTSPINIYGASKLSGEINALENCTKSYVLRTSWLYDVEHVNFLTTMLNLARTRATVSVVDDQIGQPTSVSEVSNAVWELCVQLPSFGIYNLTCSGSTSWFGFAQKIFELAGLDSGRVTRVSSAEFQRPARRPKYSVLSNAKWLLTGMTPLSPWSKAAEDLATEIRNYYVSSQNE